MQIAQETIKLSQQIIAQWRQERVRLNSGATEQEIYTFENSHNLRLPADFRYFYTQVNGMTDGLSDNHLFSLWSIQDIAKHPMGVIQNSQSRLHTTQVMFGDFSIDSYRYFLNFDITGNCSVMTQLSNEAKIANSFTEFLQYYLSNPENIHLW